MGDPSDPLSLNRYVYCGLDPVNNVDPTGFCSNPLLFMLGFAVGQSFSDPDKGLPDMLDKGFQGALLFSGAGFVYNAYKFYNPSFSSRSSLVARNSASNKSIMLGETMNRVETAAKEYNSSIFKPISSNFNEMMIEGETWLREQIAMGKQVNTVGIDLSREIRSPFYEMEMRVCKELGVIPNFVDGF